MKKFYITVLLLCPFFAIAGFDDIKIFENNYEIVFSKAKRERKAVMVLYYADWCGFCQKLFNETLPDKDVQNALVAGFVNYKIQNATQEGQEFSQKYGIRSLPTFLFFDADGNLIQKIAGNVSKSGMFDLINKVYKEDFRLETPRQFVFTPSKIESKKFGPKPHLLNKEIPKLTAETCRLNADCPEDSNPCTTAFCNLSTNTCAFVNNAASCNDNNPCTINDICSAGVCMAGTPKACSDGNTCTSDLCNVNTGACYFADNTASCNDGNACTTNDVCSGGSCQSGSQRVCNDNNACTDDACNPSAGCIFTVDNSNTCNDNNVCTTNDQCLNGTCSGTQSSCPDDGNVCTTASCNSITGCFQAFNTNACDDVNPQTINDVCANGICRGEYVSAGEITPTGITIPKYPSARTCNASLKSFMYYNSTENHIYVCDGTNWKKLNQVDQMAFESVMSSTIQAIPAGSTPTVIDFQTNNLNLGNAFDLTANSFTVPSTGFYTLTASTCIDGSGPTLFSLQMVDLVGNVLTGQLGTISGKQISCTVSKQFTQGEKVLVNVVHNEGISKDIRKDCTRFSGFKVY